MKALVGAFNQEKALGVFPEILKLRVGSFPAVLALYSCLRPIIGCTHCASGRTCASEAKAAKEMEIEKD